MSDAKDEELMMVGDVVEMAGVSKRTLQYYDKIGLLPATARTDAGYRLYSSEVLDILREISYYKSMDFDLKEIREILYKDGYDIKTYIKTKGTKDSSMGYIKLRYFMSSSSTFDETVYLEYDPDDDTVNLELVADNKLSSGAHMSSVTSIYYDSSGNSKMYFTDFTYDPYETMKHTGMLKADGLTVSQIGGERSYSWSVLLNSGSGGYTFTDSQMKELADTSVELTLTTVDLCLKYKLSGIDTSIADLGFID